MKKKLLDLILKNPGLKITALIFAIILWFFVVSVNDPDNTRTMVVPVTVVNQDVLDATNEYFTLPGKTTATFQVTGKRSVIDKLTPANFSATADMINLDRENSRIPIEIQPLSYASSVTLIAKARYLDVSIGQKRDKKLVVTGAAMGTPAEGFAVADVTVSPNIIRITGPSEVVNQITTATAYIDVEGMSSDILESAVLSLRDASGEEIDNPMIESNITTVDVTAHIRSVKTLPIKVETQGELKEGLALGKITAEPERIAVLGPGSVLNDLTEIVVPPTVIDLSTITNDFETTVDVSAYLPREVSLLNSKEGTIKIKVELLKKETKEFEIPAANFTFTNVNAGMKAHLQEEKLRVEITGLPAELEKLRAENITGSVDCSGLTEGSHKVNVKLNLNEGLNALTVSADVMISPDLPGDNENTNSGTSAHTSSASSSGT